MAPTSLELILAQKARLASLQDRRQRELVRAWARAWDEINADLLRTIEKMMREAEAGTPAVSRAVKLRRQREALRIVSDQLEQLLRDARITASDDAARMIRLASSDTLRLIQAQLPLDESTVARVVLTRADSGQIEQVVQRTTEQITARHVALNREAQVALRRELLRAIAVGDNPKDAARRMVGRVKGEFDGGMVRALVIARTEQVDGYRRAAQVSQDANADVLQGWQWICTLTRRTCPSCIAHHGEVHPLSEPGPEDHHQGRCARMPLTKSWRDLGFNLPDPEPAVKPGDGVRWLEKQPPRVQREALGEARFDAWKAGDYPPEAWSVKRSTPGWRDSWHVGPVNS